MNNRDKRILDLIRQAGKTDSVEKELALINRESLRYDLDGCGSNNTTVHPGSFVLSDHFRFEWVGRDRIGGTKSCVIDYREVGSSMGALMSSRVQANGPQRTFPPRPFVARRDHLSVTAGTIRDRWGSPGPIGTGYAYAPTAGKHYMRITPSVSLRLNVLSSTISIPRKRRKIKPPAFGIVCRTTLTYGRFRRFDVTTQIQTIAPPER